MTGRATVIVWLMLALQTLTTLAYASERKWPQSVYWLGAVLLTTGVLWMSRKL